MALTAEQHSYFHSNSWEQKRNLLISNDSQTELTRCISLLISNTNLNQLELLMVHILLPHVFLNIVKCCKTWKLKSSVILFIVQTEKDVPAEGIRQACDVKAQLLQPLIKPPCKAVWKLVSVSPEGRRAAPAVLCLSWLSAQAGKPPKWKGMCSGSL